MHKDFTAFSGRVEIMGAFAHLKKLRGQREGVVSTKQEEMRREDDRKALAAAEKYTVETIVKEMADLQLQFGGALQDVSEKIESAASRLDELQRAIAVETARLQSLSDMRIAVEALGLMTAENEQAAAAFDDETKQRIESTEQEISETKARWEREEKAYQERMLEQQSSLEKGREKQEADYQYTAERQRKIARDEFEWKKKNLERMLAEERETLEKNWLEREKKIAERGEELKAYQAQAEGFEARLEKETATARKNTIREVEEQAQVNSDLFEKEAAANREVFTLRIASLEEAVKKQNQQNESLAGQLREARSQVQALAVKTVESGGERDS